MHSKKNLYVKKKLVKNWFLLLRDTICHEFEKIEIDFGKVNKEKPNYFQKTSWKKSLTKNEGGGTFCIIKNGLVFEKVGVNLSEVNGKFDKNFKSEVWGTKKNPNYWASGISVVAHFKNPKIPAMHFNTRFIITSKWWFGGGMDATPSLVDNSEKNYFHKKIKKTCDKHDKTYYPKYKKWCDDYFFIKHRKESRGIGGIFFDHKRNNWKKDFIFVQDMGLLFLDNAINIIRKKMFTRWNQKQKNAQLIKRGRYVEFNLLYDRGTKFGLSTGGNTEAIFMSLPPNVQWD